MSKLAIICAPDKAAISAMAEKISAGAIPNGATADIFDATVDPAVLGGYDAAALGFGEGFAESAVFRDLKAKRQPFSELLKEKKNLRKALRAWAKPQGA